MRTKKFKRSAVAALAAGGLGVGMLVATAGGAGAQQPTVELDYTCVLPLVDEEPMPVTVTVDLAQQLGKNESSGQIAIDSVATLVERVTWGLGLIQAKTIEGTVTATSNLTAPGVENLPLSVPITIPQQEVPPMQTVGSVDAHGTAPAITFYDEGPGEIGVGDLMLNIIPRDANGEPIWGFADHPDGSFDAPCTLDEGQDATVATFNVTDNGYEDDWDGAPGVGGDGSLSVDYRCAFPIVGYQTLPVDINVDLPEQVPVGDETDEFLIEAVASINEDVSLGLDYVDVATIEGTVTASANLSAPGYPNLPLAVPVDVAPHDVPEGASAFDVTATGSTPALTFHEDGVAHVTVSDISMTMVAKRADGSIVPLDSSSADGSFTVDCHQGGEGVSPLGSFEIGDGETENNAPVAVDGSASTEFGESVAIELVATDEDGDELTFSVVDEPANGVVGIEGSVATYTPEAGFAGEDSFTFVANDGLVDSNVATVVVTVEEEIVEPPENNAPVAVDGSASTEFGESVAIELVATDEDGDELTFSVVDEPANGVVGIEGSVATYTPEAGFAGEDSFTFVANDGLVDSNVATVTVTVADEDVAPGTELKAGDIWKIVEGNQPTVLELPITASEGAELTVTVTEPTHGTAEVDGTAVIFTPEKPGKTSFTYTVTDAQGGEATGKIDLIVKGDGTAWWAWVWFGWFFEQNGEQPLLTW